MKLETGDAVRKLTQMTPLKAWVKTGGGFSEVDSAQVELGQLVEMRKLFYPALYLKPELAGLAMALSSITVTANALRLRRA